MEPIQIAEKLKESFPEEVLSIGEFRGQVSVAVKKDMILEMARFLHDTPDLDFDYLRDLTAVDNFGGLGKNGPRFDVVYHFYSIKHRHMLRLKAQVAEEDCSIQSLMPVYVGANWHERECFDLFGVRFEGHPDLRRILLAEDWEGHPLRKDYPTAGPGPENEWIGFKQVVERAKCFKKYEWNRDGNGTDK